ncbi:MAG: DUF86 domain-containing protein [Vulcanisaeta sp.]|jgi:uncharacterized protein YutE (UPF0331/DUF86 family)|nr:DUF86 domain-containing protein [Vulcanisaeta sp.]MCG2886932.1 DUF86 domain-containing protein [Vulcanisaeta sp.]
MGVDWDYVDSLIRDVMDSINRVNRYVSKPYSELSEEERLAIRYLIITMVESLNALALHIVRRHFNERPETPIHSLRVLRDGGLIDEACLRDIVALIRLRNLLVHRYWVIDDERVYWSVRNNFKCILALLDSIRGLRGR